MPTAWCTAASLKWHTFMCIMMKRGEMTRTNPLSNASQPRCRLPPWNSYVHHLPCRDPKKEVLLWSLPEKSPATKMARHCDKMIWKQNIFYAFKSFPYLKPSTESSLDHILHHQHHCLCRQETILAKELVGCILLHDCARPSQLHRFALTEDFLVVADWKNMRSNQWTSAAIYK